MYPNSDRGYRGIGGAFSSEATGGVEPGSAGKVVGGVAGGAVLFILEAGKARIVVAGRGVTTVRKPCPDIVILRLEVSVEGGAVVVAGREGEIIPGAASG